MLVNFTNHPYENWPENQLLQAQKEYGYITNLAFPNIAPDLGTEELNLLVSCYLKKIIPLQPAAIHIMGEMTFAYRMINLLKESGIKCIASTTLRQVIVEGNIKESVFRFVQFREY